VAPSLNRYERHLLKAMSSWFGTPAEQVAQGGQSCAPVVENCHAVQAQELAQQVGAGVGRSTWQVEMVVGARKLHQQLCLESRSMPWGGGIKFHLLCACGRRCAKLYLPPEEDRFACRHCHRLLYWDQRYKPRRAAGKVAPSPHPVLAQ
jgi:hypothetical protein